MRPSSRARQAFVRVARDAGHTVHEHGEVVELGWGRVRCVFDAPEVTVRPGLVAVQISALVESPKLTPAWRDDFVGIAGGEDEAFEEGMRAWVAGPLELLRDALAEKPAEHRFALAQQAPAGERTWLVFEGPLQLTGPGEVQRALVETLEETPLFGRLAEAQAVPELAPDRAHVLKLYAAKLGDAPALVEALLDGAPMPAIADELTRFPWPASERHRTLRQYYCFVPR